MFSTSVSRPHPHTHTQARNQKCSSQGEGYIYIDIYFSRQTRQNCHIIYLLLKRNGRIYIRSSSHHVAESYKKKGLARKAPAVRKALEISSSRRRAKLPVTGTKTRETESERENAARRPRRTETTCDCAPKVPLCRLKAIEWERKRVEVLIGWETIRSIFHIYIFDFFSRVHNRGERNRGFLDRGTYIHIDTHTEGFQLLFFFSFRYVRPLYFSYTWTKEG